MRLDYRIVSLAVLFTAVAMNAAAGPTNPDISVIGDSRVVWSDATEDFTLEFEEVEIAFVGPVNPYASAEVFIGVHDLEEFEIEEAKLLLDRYLPGGFGLTIGHYLQDFGQLNVVHSHAFPFIERPLMHEEFFGADGIVDTGVRLDWIAPLEGVTVRATAGAVRGDLFAGGHSHDHEAAEEEAEEAEADPEVGVSGRVELFAEPSQDLSLLVGASLLHGEHDPAEDGKVTWIDVDLKGKLDLGPDRSLVVNAEGVFGSLDATEESPAADPNGWFLSADLRTSRRWNLGAFAESTTERTDDGTRTHRYGGFLGHSLLEESTLFRLVGHVTDVDGNSEFTVMLQALFALGPHRPHRY